MIGNLAAQPSVRGGWRAVQGNPSFSRNGHRRANYISSQIAPVGGIALAGRVGAATPTAAVGLELAAITAVVLGGTPLTGGVGNMTNTVVGAFIISILLNGMVIIGVPSEMQLVIQGLVLVGAVYLSIERIKIGIIK